MSTPGLAAIASALDRAGVRFMVTGSTASTFYGEPRTTHDIDIVLELTDASLDAFLRELPEDDWYAARKSKHAPEGITGG